MSAAATTSTNLVLITDFDTSRRHVVGLPADGVGFTETALCGERIPVRSGSCRKASLITSRAAANCPACASVFRSAA